MSATLVLIAGTLNAGPNVIVFLADDLGSADLGCVGCKDIATPNIDALAASGVRFTNFYVNAPVCSPSRAALLTGRDHVLAGVPTNVSSQPNRPGMPTSEITFAELVAPLGYRTGLFGKWHLGTTPETLPNGQGFNEFFGFQSGCLNYYTHVFTYEPPARHDLWRNTTEVRENGKYLTELFEREAIKFMTENRDRPFLMYVPFNAPHYPMQAPKPWFEKYKHLTADRQAYAAMVSAMDHSIGKIMGAVAELGLREKTLVFFLSDHGATVEARAGGGGGSNAPYRGFKFSLFEGGIRSPLIVSWPGKLPTGATRVQLATSLDVFPTIVDAAGAKLPNDRIIDGVSLMPILTENAPSKHKRLFWHIGRDFAVREGKWKLVVQQSGNAEPKRLLFDLEADPSETRDLSQVPEHRATVVTLVEKYEAWMSRVAKAGSKE